ncbi:amidase [Jiella sonneratiae]|uniref:Amidase n=1 Tax=Jiella sonneratiae TaxID=2816856 RepID=A0ABS3IZQ4_9HYPH|nr:amidase [Jiella sonneratiae]MBO0902892.1 amidase [Jiella sonneratiae]
MEYDTLLQVSGAIRRHEVSPVEVTAAMLSRIEALDAGHRSYAAVLAERAGAKARQAESEIARGIWRGPLHGVPVAVKDLCYTTFAPTTAGTKIHRDFVPGHDATVVARLEAAGAVILGKLKMTEGAYTTHHPEVDAPLNPWNPAYWAGSSSSGSGVAPAAGLAYGALGSDTGGSIRFPSAACGLTGIKPTWGRVSRHGVFALADSLDHVGPMARSAGDAAAILGVVAGADRNDPTALQAPVPDYLAALRDGVRGMTIGIDRSYAFEGIDPEAAAALAAAEAVFSSLGAKIREVRFPPHERLVSLWIPMCAVETAIAHRDTYPARKDDYGPELAGLIEEGRALGGLDLCDILHERLTFNGALAAMFTDIDAFLIPTMPMRLPSLTDLAAFGDDPEVLVRLLRFTAPFDFSGFPTITLPHGFDSDGLPLSMQLAGAPLSEGLLATAAHAFQTQTDWHTRRPQAPPPAV